MDQSGIIEELFGLLNRLTVEKGVPEQKALVDKNISQNGSSAFDANKKVSPVLRSDERRRTVEIATLFAKTFDEYNKRTADSKPKTLIASVATSQRTAATQPKMEKGSMGSVLALLAGGVALVAAAVPTIIASLFQKVGPLADTLKVLGKVGLIGGLKLIAKSMSKFFGATVLKRIPIVGSLINFYFAYKEFKAGRYVPALMELAAGIVNFVPGLGTALSIGIDVLKVFLDANGSFDEGGALSNTNALGTIKQWGSNIGKWIWDNALWMPVIGGIKRFSMAKDAFSSGNVKEGIYQLGTGLISFVGGAPIVRGLEVLMGFLGNNKEETGDFKEDNSWMSRMKKWIKDKLKDLPDILKKPLEWFGILDSTDNSKASFGDMSQKAKQGLEGVKTFTSQAWDTIKGPMGEAVSTVSKFATDTWNKTKDFASSAWEKTKEEAPKIWNSIKETSASAWDKTKEMGSWFANSISDMASKAKAKVEEWVPGLISSVEGVTRNAMKVLKSIADKIGSWIGGLFSPEEEKKLQTVSINNISEKDQLFQNKQLDLTLSMLQSSGVQNKWLTLLYDAAKEQVRLLGALVNVSGLSYQELKRMNGNTSGGGNVQFTLPAPQSQKELVPVGDNRMGFANSPYSFSH